MIQPDDCRVFLANLSFEADEDDVRELAGHHGEVRRTCTSRRISAQTSIAAWRSLATAGPDDAAAIVKALEGVTHLGRRLRC